jgi:hypothetical protein
LIAEKYPVRIVMLTIGHLNFSLVRHPRYDDCLPEYEVLTCGTLVSSCSSMHTSQSGILMM